MVTDNQFIATKLNLDKHYTLLESRDITYLLNGGIEGYESSNQNYFVQNQKSNELCFELPSGYQFAGPGISVGESEHVFFITDTSNSQILVANLDDCDYEVWASGECLGFEVRNPVRGVYKYNAQENSRTIYFVDEINPNRYANIDKPYPKTKVTDDCETCEKEYSTDLDCDQLRINKMINVPCIEIEGNNQGTLSSGVYQVGFAWSQNGVILSDFYFSDVIKVWSDRPNIGLNISLDCVDAYSAFNEYTIVLVSTTKEGSLVLYKIGDYSFPTSSLSVVNLDNATVIDLSVATQKQVKYDNSKHIVTNGETLLFGDSRITNTIPYQIQATQIQIGWQEIKVPKEDAYKYPTFMRDEVYAFAIEWYKTSGESLGRFEIPGRPYDDTYEYTPGFGYPNPYKEYDLVPAEFNIYSDPECEEEELSAWQITSTAYTVDDFGGDCNECVTGTNYGQYGKMGYYECLDLTYPDEPELWGDLSCQRIRRHRMPSHNISHLYESGDCGLQLQTYFDEDGVPQEVSATTWIEGNCVNLLGITVDGVTPPLDTNGDPVEDVLGFRILYSKRDGYKSILHKGLIFNMMQEVNGLDPQEIVLYPNYPFNDIKFDVYLGKEQSPKQSESYSHQGNANIDYNKWTYHSPDIHFRETKNEFGTELKLYTQEVGGIQGNISKVYRHPEQSSFKEDGVVSASFLFNYANQVDLAANFSKYNEFSSDFRQSFLITKSQYLLPIKQFVGDKKVNNFLRETSFYMELAEQQVAPNLLPYNFVSEVDTSRVLASDLVENTNLDDLIINYCTVVNQNGNDRTVQGVSMYCGIKVPQPNQYGEVGSTTFTPVDSCIITGDPSGESYILSGGDVYISRHSKLKKMPLFTEWLYDVPFDTLIDYRDKRNVWFPRFWWNNLTEEDVVRYRLDNYYQPLLFFGITYGRFYTSVNGNAYFWCESEFIGDYRETDIRPQTQFFPKASVPDLTRSDRFALENIWLYDFSLLNGSIDQYRLSSQVALLNSLNPDYNLGDFIVHYSLKDDPQAGYDNWLVYLPLNYTVLPRIYGDFTGMHYIDQYSILFSFENATLYSQEDYTLTINQGNSLFLAQGDIFSRRLRKWSNEGTGYTGSVDSFFPINTRYGTLLYDRYRKEFLLWTNQLTPITDLKVFLNNFNDKSNTSYRNSMITVYDNLTDCIYITDKQRGWTISFNPKFKGFISFHSFVPDWYVQHHNTYLSIKDDSLWKHNADGYQTYYGTLYPFEVEFVIKQFPEVHLQDISLFTDYIDYEGYGQVVQRPDKFFTKLFVYNNRYSTGLLNINLKDVNDPNQSIQNKETIGTADVTQVQENIYRINKLDNNQINSPNIQYGSDGVSYTLQNINQNRPPHQRERLTGRWFKAHLIDDENSESKILVQLNLSQTDETKR